MKSDAALHAMQRCLQHYVLAASSCRTGLLVPFGTQISLGIPSSSDVQIPEFQDFLDIQARILGRQHGKNTKLSESFCEKYLLGLQLRLNQMDGLR